MLEVIREKMQGTFATVIVVFLCAVFALWGAETLFDRAGSPQAVATVNGQEITDRELAGAIDMMRRRYTEMLGGKVDPSFLNDKMLREPALDSLINRRLLQDESERLKMTVGQVSVDKAIVRDPTFSRDGKTFDPEYYREVLRSSGLSAASYQEQLRQQLVLNHLQAGISNTAFITERQVEDLARLAVQKRSFSYLLLPLQKVREGIVPTDEEVATHYQQHQDQFMSEEKVIIEYLELDKASLMAGIEIADDEIRAAYDKDASTFKPASERRAAHILVDASDEKLAQTKLDEIQTKLAAGDAFEKLAKQYSIDEGSAGQGGDVGFSAGDAFVPEFEAALAALQQPGDVSPPVKTEFGYHLIKLLEQRETTMPAYEERKAELATQLRQVRVASVYAEQLDRLSESTYSAGDLAGPAAELGMAIQKSQPFGRRGGAGIAAQQKVIEAAFSAELLDTGKNSQVIELTPDKALVLRVSDHQLPKLRELAEVRQEIVDRLKNEKAAVLLKEKALQLESAVRSGTALDAAAAGQDLGKPIALAAQSRTAAGVPRDVLEAAFRMPRPDQAGAVTQASALENGDWVLLQLTAVLDETPDPSSSEYQSVRQRLSSIAANSSFALYEQMIRDTAEITRRGDSSQE